MYVAVWAGMLLTLQQCDIGQTEPRQESDVKVIIGLCKPHLHQPTLKYIQKLAVNKTTGTKKFAKIQKNMKKQG